MNNPSTCPHFSLCSGCEIATDALHPPIWREIQTFFVSHHTQPTLHTDGFTQTRYKAKLAVRPGPKIGLFRKNTHEVIPIPSCLVHHPAINRAVALIQQEIIAHSLPAYDEQTGTGLLRYVQLFVDRSTHWIQLALIATEPRLDPFCRSLSRHDLWHSIWVNHQPARTNRILGDTWHLFSGEPFLWQTVYRTPIAFHPGAFSQTHLPLFDKMVQRIAAWVQPTHRVLELYAGVGAIGLNLPTPHLTLVENNPFARLSFEQCGKDVPYLCIDAREADVSGYDVLIVDPPRKGLDPLLLQKLSALPSGRLIYVSCGFASFERDAEALLQAGWRFSEAHGYLLFPGTNHVEILALLEKII